MGGGGGAQMPFFNGDQITKDQVKANVNAANMSQMASNVNQVTPYGNLKYDQTGGTYDFYGNFVPTYTATQTFSPEQQALYNQSTGLKGQANTAAASMANAPDMGLSRDQAYGALMSRQRQELDQQRQQTIQNSANQGVAPGSVAYNRALQPIDQASVDAVNQATIQAGALQGQNIANFGSLAALGSPTNPSFVNTPQYQMQAPDVTSAPMAAYNAQMQAYAQQQAQAQRSQGGLLGSLFGLAGTIGGGIAGSPGFGKFLFGSSLGGGGTAP